MAGPLSVDRKLRVAAALAAGDTARGAASRFWVPVAAAVRIGQCRRAGRGLETGKIGGHRRPVLQGAVGDWLLAGLAEKPDLTMRGLAAELAARATPCEENQWDCPYIS